MTAPRFNTVLVANRGEIAVRILRSIKAMGMRAVIIGHAVDAGSPAENLADVVMRITGDTPVAAFLDIPQIIALAGQAGAGAIHPGYGFLAENADFAAACAAAGIVFIGPRPETIRLMGDKIRARKFVASLGEPVLPSAIEDDDPESFLDRAAALGAPLLIKPSAGGGGKGMRIVRDIGQLADEMQRARSEAQRYFGDGRLYAERYVENPRHIEVQVIGDEFRKVLHLFERDCTLQRRFQKIVEEAPAACLTPGERAGICETARSIAAAANYIGAGTVEFVYGDGQYYFLEMNTRLQVEHPVTEAVTGIDLVETQIDIALGKAIPFTQGDVTVTGHAVELRICAETPQHAFAPATGTILALHAPSGPRFDCGFAAGSTVGTSFDSLIGKLILHAQTRQQALQQAREALAQLVIFGLPTNAAYLSRLLGHPAVVGNELHTGLVSQLLDILPEPSLTPAEKSALEALAMDAIPDLAIATPRLPKLHASIAGWRN